MTEQELVTWTKTYVEDGIKVALQVLNDVKSLNDLEEFRKRMKYTAKELKVSIDMMESYLSVNEAIMNNTKYKEP